MKEICNLTTQAMIDRVGPYGFLWPVMEAKRELWEQSPLVLVADRSSGVGPVVGRMVGELGEMRVEVGRLVSANGRTQEVRMEAVGEGADVLVFAATVLWLVAYNDLSERDRMRFDLGMKMWGEWVEEVGFSKEQMVGVTAGVIRHKLLGGNLHPWGMRLISGEPEDQAVARFKITYGVYRALRERGGNGFLRPEVVRQELGYTPDKLAQMPMEEVWGMIRARVEREKVV